MYGIRKNFGFGCMRLPTIENKDVDIAQFTRMVDTFLAGGFNYFDTARGYLGGKSETALRTCLTSRYPRKAYILTDKLSGNFFNKQEDIRPFFESQLETLGVEYLDFYLMHAQDRTIFEKFKRCRAYETALALKEEGKFLHFGISFHDTADMLEKILTEYPQIEVVQIQFNYADYDDVSVQSRLCYEVCRKHGKPVIVMEPVKGGSLVRLSDEAQKVFDNLHGGSNASYAIRFAASFEGVMMVLSGMSDMAMLEDNLSYMKDFRPLDENEKEAIRKVCAIFKKQDAVPCTACRYCIDRCPKKIPIPELFACLNAKRTFCTWNTDYYSSIHTSRSGKASDCVRCGLCEESCPQHLPIRELLCEVAQTFERRK